MSIIFSIQPLSSLWAMEETRVDFFQLLPQTLQIEIFSNLNFSDVIAVIQVCKAFESQKENNSRFLIQKVLNIAKLDFESILNIVSDKNFASYEAHLLKHFEIITINTFKTKVQSNNDLAMWLVANSIINFSAANNAAWSAASSVSKKAAGEDASSDAMEASSVSYWSSASEAIGKLAWRDKYKTATGHAWKAIWGGAWESAKKAAEHTLTLVKISGSEDDLGLYYWKLSNLFLLAHISQDDFLTYSEAAFNIAKEEFDRHGNCYETKEKILKLWGRALWGNNELENNPYIISLKNIALVLSSHILRNCINEQPEPMG